MIARPKLSQNEWKTTEIQASKVGNFSPFSCPGQELILEGAAKWAEEEGDYRDDITCMVLKVSPLSHVEWDTTEIRAWESWKCLTRVPPR